MGPCTVPRKAGDGQGAGCLSTLQRNCSSLLKLLLSERDTGSPKGCDFTVQGEVLGGQSTLWLSPSTSAHPSPSLYTGAGGGVRCKVMVTRTRGSHLPHALAARVVQCWDVVASERRTVRLKTYPFPSCPLASSLPPSLSHPSLLFCLSPSLVFTHSLSGRAASEGPVQRSVAATETGTTGSCNSEWISTPGAAGSWGLVPLEHEMTHGVERLWD